MTAIATARAAAFGLGNVSSRVLDRQHHLAVGGDERRRSQAGTTSTAGELACRAHISLLSMRNE
jgi:hypothetical protein